MDEETKTEGEKEETKEETKEPEIEEKPEEVKEEETAEEKEEETAEEKEEKEEEEEVETAEEKKEEKPEEKEVKEEETKESAEAKRRKKLEEKKRKREEIKQEKKRKREEKRRKKEEEQRKKKESKEERKRRRAELKRGKAESEWYDKNYKKLFLISIIVLAASLIYIFVFYAQHGDIMFKDVTLTGGTIITVYTDAEIDTVELTGFLEDTIGDSKVRLLQDIGTRRQIAFIVETKADVDPTQQALEEYLDYKLDANNSSIEFNGASLSQDFYRQLIIALVLAFVFMAIVIFLIFKSLVPSIAVILASFTDIVGALAIANIFGFSMSTAGIAAFLMLIGYSVDTDVMLTTKVLKRRGEGPLNSRLKASLRTGLTMTITSFLAVLIGFFVVQSVIIKQIFFILAAGLFIDMISTWFGNAAILKWWCEKKKIS